MQLIQFMKLKQGFTVFKITSKRLLIGAALVGAWLIYKNSLVTAKRVPTLAELNPDGGGSIFEIYGNGK